MRCTKPSSPAENELWSLLIYWDKHDIEYNVPRALVTLGNIMRKKRYGMILGSLFGS